MCGNRMHGIECTFHSGRRRERIRAARRYNPGLTFWISPWSPPSWMKINHDYPVVSSRHNDADPNIDYLLYGSVEGIDEDEMKFLGERNGKFPLKLATQDYFIQDPGQQPYVDSVRHPRQPYSRRSRKFRRF